MTEDIILYIPIYGLYRAYKDESILYNANRFNFYTSAFIQAISLSIIILYPYIHY